MKYRHYSPTDDLVGMTLIDFTNDQAPHFKPRGFWISDDSDYGWAKWCKASDFGAERLQHKYSVELAKDARILYIRGPEALDDFTRRYRDKTPCGANEIVKDVGPQYGHPPDTMHIDWPAIAKQYQGIMITPYLWSRRLGIACSWYYAWDCASGCIWDPAAIGTITKLKHKAPKVAA